MRITDPMRGTGDGSTRLMSWKYAKTCGVGGSRVMLEIYKCYIERMCMYVYLGIYGSAQRTGVVVSNFPGCSLRLPDLYPFLTVWDQ